MKTLSFIILLAMTFLTFSNANAQYMLPSMGYGIDAGIARGDNAGNNDKYSLIMRGNIQMRVIQPILGQVSVGFAKLSADGVNSYSVQPLLIDGRLLFAPIRMDQMFPFIYAGFGVSKDMSNSGSSFLPFIPVGLGIQTAIGPQLMLKANVGYNLVLSDKLDDHVRTSGHMNRFTNGKHDGFSEIMVGLVYTGPSYPKTTDNE